MEEERKRLKSSGGMGEPVDDDATGLRGTICDVCLVWMWWDDGLTDSGARLRSWDRGLAKALVLTTSLAVGISTQSVVGREANEEDRDVGLARRGPESSVDASYGGLDGVAMESYASTRSETIFAVHLCWCLRVFPH